MTSAEYQKFQGCGDQTCLHDVYHAWYSLRGTPLGRSRFANIPRLDSVVQRLVEVKLLGYLRHRVILATLLFDNVSITFDEGE